MTAEHRSASTGVERSTTGKDGSPQFAIEIVGVSKRFGQFVALGGIDLDILPGEFIVLLGPSGCGKSTLLKIIAGLEDASSGEVYVDGRLANYLRPKDRDVAMVFQNYALYPHMTVATNIGFPLAMRKVSREETALRVREVTDMLGLTDQLERYPDELSGGQRQRVALGRAIIRQPVAFLMDEPLSNLDALLRVQMRTELLKLHRRVGRTTVYVTHDQVEAMTMADRIVVMRDGLIQQIGPPGELYARPATTFVATFVGSPPMNLFEGRLAGSADGLVFEGPFSRPVGRAVPGISAGQSVVLSAGQSVALSAGQSVALGIRPEHIEVGSPDEPHSVAGTVELVETVGADSYLSTLLAPDVTCIVRVGADSSINEGDRIGLRFPMPRVCLFGEDGQRIGAA